MCALPLLFTLVVAALARAAGEESSRSGTYRSVAPEEVGDATTAVVVTIEFDADGGLSARPPLGALLSLSEFGAGLTWRLLRYDAMAPNILRLMTDDGEPHDLGADASSPYGGTFTWHVAPDGSGDHALGMGSVVSDAATGMGGAGSSRGQCAEGGEGQQHGCDAAAPEPRRGRHGSALSVRAREQRLAAVHSHIAAAATAFGRSVNPDSSHTPSPSTPHPTRAAASILSRNAAPSSVSTARRPRRSE